jgi:hypothetical protein
MLLTRQRNNDYCQDYLRDASRGPTIEFDSKGENTMEYKLGEIAKI